ncbi:MAG: hypothetical protein QXE06_06400 [Candidatus Bathyarchaeia archaeon]
MEYNFRETIIHRSFTTKRKKKVSIVLRRCLDFIYNRVVEGYRDEIPAKVFDLKFKEEIGWDRITLKKYLGYNKQIYVLDGMGKKRSLRDEKHEPGAFERFGLLERIPHPQFPSETLAWRILPYFWIKLKEVYPQRKIVEWFSKQQYGERVGKNGNISLTEWEQTLETGSIENEASTDAELENISLIGKSREVTQTTNNATNITKTKQTNNNSERDIFYGPPPISDMLRYASTSLTPEEEAILNAKPLDEPDRAEIRWKAEDVSSSSKSIKRSEGEAMTK